MPFKKTVFGGDINILTKKRLEARQHLSGGTKAPNQSIISQYPHETENAYSYQELLNLQGDFGGANDLSSRTPFARMWTAVQVYTTKTFLDGGTPYKTEEEAKTQSVNLDKKFIPHVVPIEGGFGIRQISGNEIMIYEVNNHNRLFKADPNQSIFGEDGASTQLTSKVAKEQFNIQGSDNENFLKPPAGITSVDVQTEGALGSIKRTTVNFVVHSFGDFENIYNRYFLKPGALLFLDIGWDTAEIYNPKDVVLEENYKNLTFIDPIPTRTDDVLDYYVNVKSKGDLEVIYGYVTKFDSKLNNTGGFDCSVEIVSVNNGLVDHKISEDNKLRQKFIQGINAYVVNLALASIQTMNTKDDPNAT